MTRRATTARRWATAWVLWVQGLWPMQNTVGLWDLESGTCRPRFLKKTSGCPGSWGVWAKGLGFRVTENGGSWDNVKENGNYYHGLFKV